MKQLDSLDVIFFFSSDSYFAKVTRSARGFAYMRTECLDTVPLRSLGTRMSNPETLNRERGVIAVLIGALKSSSLAVFRSKNLWRSSTLNKRSKKNYYIRLNGDHPYINLRWRVLTMISMKIYIFNKYDNSCNYSGTIFLGEPWCDSRNRKFIIYFTELKMNKLKLSRWPVGPIYEMTVLLFGRRMNLSESPQMTNVFFQPYRQTAR